jgi:hypothetical protein
MSDGLDRIDAVIDAPSERSAPAIGSLKEFLLEHSRVKLQSGQYGAYTFEGRECLEEIVDTFDLVFGSHTGEPLKDAQLDICGGAQWGKTIFGLNTGVYVTAVLGRNWGYYLPDDDLVEGVVDTKFRPDVIDQIDWLGPMMALGKSQDKRGRIVNRKGAFQVTDGKRVAFGMIRGMGKIPTTFSMDVAMEDEKDDIPEKRSKFLSGRMTASDLRMRCSIGTQRVFGRGQQKQWKDGSQGVEMFAVPGGEINLEESWPQVCRMAVAGAPRADDPQLDYTAEFVNARGDRWAAKPGALYYLADPETGAVIDRHKPRWEHRQPHRIEKRHWSWRISQLGCAALDLQQVVSRWESAVKDPESMVVFCCDVLAIPGNTAQGINDQIILRARGEHDLSLASATAAPIYAGLDTGDRCWFVSRVVESPAIKRVNWIEQITLGDVVAKTVKLCNLMNVAVLMIDARPHAQQARQICWTLHGLDDFKWPKVDDPEKAKIKLGDLTWDGDRGEWLGLRAAVVEFSRKPGQGVIHKLGQHQEGGETRFYPIIQASRYDSIDRVVSEFLTPKENVIRVVDGQLLEEPVIRLPRNVAGSPPIVATFDRHLMVGSERDEKGEYVDQCENHLLLANAYSALAEQIGGSRHTPAPVAYEPIKNPESEEPSGGLFGSFRRVLRGAI